MNKKFITYLLVALPFIIIYILSKIYFTEYYLFEWTTRHYYCYIWVLAFVLILFKKELYSFALSISNVLGIVIGQFLGDFLRNQNMLAITSETDNETIYRLSQHKGVMIWIITMMITIAVVYVINYIVRRKSL